MAVKYILLAVLLLAFLFNFKCKAIIKFLFKKEITENTEMALRCTAYVLAVACVICIMVFC